MESRNADRKLSQRALDHLIVLNDVHLRRLIRDYISYYHADRIHDSLEKDTPVMRPVSSKPNQSARLVSLRPPPPPFFFFFFFFFLKKKKKKKKKGPKSAPDAAGEP